MGRSAPDPSELADLRMDMYLNYLLVHETIDVATILVRAYLDIGLMSYVKRNHKVSFAFDMHSTLIYDGRSLQTMPWVRQSANHRFTQDGLLILAPYLLSFYCF